MKDAFLMVDQEKPMVVALRNRLYRVKGNLPGQRLGAKMWYWSFREFLTKELAMEWCVEQPCLAKNSQCCVMVHVDGVMFAVTGSTGKTNFGETQTALHHQPFTAAGH